MSVKTKLATVVDIQDGRKLNVLGHDVLVMLGSAETEGECFAFETVTPPGLFVPPHVHEYEDEYGFIIEGTFEVMLGGRIFEASAGAVVYCPRQIAHGFRNIGPTSARMVWFSTPGANVEDLFNELGALPAAGPPDLERVTDIFTSHDMQVLPPPAM